MPRKVETACVKKDDLKIAQSYNPNISDDSDQEVNVKNIKVKRQYRKRSKKHEDNIMPVSKKAKTEKEPPTVTPLSPSSLKKVETLVHEKPSNNNDALEKGKTVKVEIKREPGEQITGCQCAVCPELVKTNKIKTLILSDADANSNFIIKLKKILDSESSAPGEYFEEEDDSDTVKVKTEPVTLKTEPRDQAPVIKAEPEDNNDDPDDPLPMTTIVSPLVIRLTAPAVNKKINTASIKKDSMIYKPKVEKMMNCFLCKNGKDLSGFGQVKNHISVCVFATDGYQQFLPPKQGPKVKIGQIEEYGYQFRYKCQVEDCEESLPRKKAMGYRQFAMHCGSRHGILERWAQNSSLAGAQELYQALKNWREEAGMNLPDIPEYEVEQVHDCLLCNGEGEGGKALSFKTQDFKIQSTRNHYTKCLFDKGFFHSKYRPHLDADGKISKSLNYPCEVCPSKKTRKMGYKEYTEHMAKEHGGLEEILSDHKDEKVRQLVDKIRIK